MELDEDQWIATTTPDQVLAIEDALAKLAQEDPIAADVVKLRYFASMSVAEAADRSPVGTSPTDGRLVVRAKLVSSPDS